MSGLLHWLWLLFDHWASLYYFPIKSGSLGSAILRNGVLMSLTFPILPIIYQQKIMMHIGKDYSWLGLVTGEVIIGF